jgi:hypothetical protein
MLYPDVIEAGVSEKAPLCLLLTLYGTMDETADSGVCAADIGVFAAGVSPCLA